MSRKLLSVDEVVAVTGLGRTKIFGLIGSGELRSVKVGKRRLVPDTAIDEFIERIEAEFASGGSDVA